MPDIYNPNNKEQELLATIYKTFNTARDERQTYDQYWEPYEKQWEGYFGDTVEDASRSSIGDYRANIWVPMTYWFTMTAISELIQQNPIIGLDPQGDEDIPLTELYEEIMKSSMDRGQFLVQFYRTILNAGILGGGWLHEYYRCDDREIKEITAYDPTKPGSVEYKKIKIHDYQDVYAEAVNPWFVYPYTWTCDSMETLNGLFRLYILNYDEFMSLYKDKYPNTKYVKSAGKYFDDTKDWGWFDGTDLQYLGADQVQVLWDFNKQKDELNIVANGVLLTSPDNPIPYKHKQIPFAYFPWVKRANRLAGKGMCEILEKMQYEQNISRNLALDQMRLNILKVFFINASAGISEDQLQLRPGFAIPVQGDPRNAVFPLEYSDIKQSFYQMSDMTNRDAEKATGIAPELTGQPSANSATQAAILKESTLKRIQLQILMYYVDGLTRFGRLRLKDIQQFYKDPVKIKKVVGDDKTEQIFREYRIVMMQNKALGVRMIPKIGETTQEFQKNLGQYSLEPSQNKYNFASLTPDIFKNPNTNHEYDFDTKVNPQSSIRISETLQKEQDKEFFDRFKNDPDIDQLKLKRDYIKAYGKNPDDLIKSSPMLPGGMAGSPVNNTPNPSGMGGNPAPQLPAGAPPQKPTPPVPAGTKAVMGSEFGGMPV